MIKTRISSALMRWLLIVPLLILPATAGADSPWAWKMSLTIEQVGDSMYMPSAVAFDTDSQRYRLASQNFIHKAHNRPQITPCVSLAPRSRPIDSSAWSKRE